MGRMTAYKRALGVVVVAVVGRTWQRACIEERLERMVERRMRVQPGRTFALAGHMVGVVGERTMVRKGRHWPFRILVRMKVLPARVESSKMWRCIERGMPRLLA
jgi:hypothetical protein